MAETAQTSPAGQGNPPQSSAQSSKPRGPSRIEQLNKLYALPAPLRTFPLPTFVPHNPLSLFHILYVWVSQSVKSEPSYFDPVYQGWFSPETRSVHVTDTRAIRGLWEQGFYGKGSLSRSEPSWLNREKTRRGKKVKVTSGEVTRQRRAERQQTKWERARKEREAIDQKLLEEAEASIPSAEYAVEKLELPPAAKSKPTENLSLSSSDLIPGLAKQTLDIENESVAECRRDSVAPVGPLGLLLLPNSHLELGSFLNNTVQCFAEDFDEKFVRNFYPPPIGPLELLALPNSIEFFLTLKAPSMDSPGASQNVTIESCADGQADRGSKLKAIFIPDSKMNSSEQCTPNAIRINGHAQLEETEIVGGSETNDDTVDGSVHSEQTTETNDTGADELGPISSSPSTPKIKRQKSVRFSPTVEKNTFMQSEPPSPERAATSITSVEEGPMVIKNQEHTQLTLEEAFFLSYALGALQVLDPETRSPISNEDLFYLCRKASYFPPQANPPLSPDDPFMINYVVYHHYRSLGWVPRSGIKFSVDFMIYQRGPVFTHAEFAVLILPSYSDPYWHSDPFLENYAKAREKRTWAWMSCINRVISQVKKTLIMTYVDIPIPLDVEEERKLGIDGVLARYKVREIVMKRWAANRMRD